MFFLFCQFLINRVTITMYVNEEYFVPKSKFWIMWLMGLVGFELTVSDL